MTFALELMTRSVSRGRGVFSLVVALLVASLTRSSVILGTFLVLAVAALAILGLRHLPRQARPLANSAVLVLAAGVAVLVVAFRSPVLQVLQARPDYLQRVALWREMLRLIDLNTIEGWGFVGFWRRDAYPYTALDLVSRGAQETGGTPTSTATCKPGSSGSRCSRRSAPSRSAGPGFSRPPSAASATSGRHSCSSSSWSRRSPRASRSWSGAGSCS